MSNSVIPNDVEENLHRIELFTRKGIRNPLVGNHISMLKGHGYDFWDHKRYQHGDDTRKIDWNATARMGYTLIKHTHEERDVDIYITADISHSMNLVSGAFSKRETLLYITATLAYSALSDHMRVGFMGFADGLEILIEARKGKGHLWNILNRVWSLEPQPHKRTSLLPAIKTLRQRLRKMSIIFLISDFLSQENIFEDLVFKQMITQNDLIPIVLQDPLEMELPQGRGFLRIRDLETGQERCIRLSRKNRIRYAEYRRQKEIELTNQFYRYGLDFQKIPTDRSFHELLSSLFLMRKRF